MPLWVSFVLWGLTTRCKAGINLNKRVRVCVCGVRQTRESCSIRGMRAMWERRQRRSERGRVGGERKGGEEEG